MTWKCPKKGADDPPALAGHSLTAVGQHGIYLFGGSGGKRPSADTYCCDPDTLTWRRVDTMGVRPDLPPCVVANQLACTQICLVGKSACA